ncbi:MAG: RrF2 family transcriptional regulator [Opitutales bacterium]
MKISLKVEYACRVLAQLARRHGATKLSHIEELATVESVPANYLVQILNELRNGGLLHSRRGKQGGYALARPPAEITLLQVVQVVDSDMLDQRASTQGSSGQAVAETWERIGNLVRDELKSITLADIQPKDSANMYYI